MQIHQNITCTVSPIETQNSNQSNSAGAQRTSYQTCNFLTCSGAPCPTRTLQSQTSISGASNIYRFIQVHFILLKLLKLFFSKLLFYDFVCGVSIISNFRHSVQSVNISNFRSDFQPKPEPADEYYPAPLSFAQSGPQYAQSNYL